MYKLVPVVYVSMNYKELIFHIDLFLYEIICLIV